jgi:hypothetical protein
MKRRPQITINNDWDPTHYYAEVNIPFGTNYYNEKFFLEKFHSKRNIFGFKCHLSNYFSYRVCIIKLPETTEKVLHNHRWQHRENSFVLERHIVTVKEEIYKLDHYKISNLVLDLIDFLQQMGRTARDLLVFVPRHEDVKPIKLFNCYPIRVENPGFISHMSEDDEHYFFLKNFPVEKWEEIKCYNLNSVEKITISEDSSLVATLPLYWFKGLILTR